MEKTEREEEETDVSQLMHVRKKRQQPITEQNCSLLPSQELIQIHLQPWTAHDESETWQSNEE